MTYKNILLLSIFFVSSVYAMDGTNWMLRKISKSRSQERESIQKKQIDKISRELLPQLAQKTKMPLSILFQREDVRSLVSFVYENPFLEKNANDQFKQVCKNVLTDNLLNKLQKFSDLPKDTLLEYQLLNNNKEVSLQEIIEQLPCKYSYHWSQIFNRISFSVSCSEYRKLLGALGYQGPKLNIQSYTSDTLLAFKKRVVKQVLTKNTRIIGTIEFADTDTDEEKERKKLIFYCARQFCNEQMKIDDDMITDVTNFNNYLRLGLQFSLGGLLTWVGAKALPGAYYEPESIRVHCGFGTLFSLVGLRGLKSGVLGTFNSYKTYKTAQRYKNVYRLLSQHARDQLNEINSEILEERKTEACCPICLEALGDENVYQTLCDHYFHQACLSKCFGNTCPICRRTNYK